MKKLLLITIFILLPFLASAQSCTSPANGCQTSQTCINGACQQGACGDGFCNNCSNAFSPCTAESPNSCPQDCGSSNPTTNYQDTDNGANFYQKGMTTGKQGTTIATKTDSCQNSQLLNEYSLDSNNNLKTQLVVCNNGCSDGKCVQNTKCAGRGTGSAPAVDNYPTLKSGDLLYFTLGAKGSADATRIYKYIAPSNTQLQIGLADMTQSTGLGDSDLVVKYAGPNCETGPITLADHDLARNYWQAHGNSAYISNNWQPPLVRDDLFYKLSSQSFEFVEIPPAKAGCYYVIVTNALDQLDDYLRLTIADLVEYSKRNY